MVVLRHMPVDRRPAGALTWGLKFRHLVLPGPVTGNPTGPRTGGYGQPAPDLEEAIPPGLESLSTPPAKGVGDERAATRAMRLATRYV